MAIQNLANQCGRLTRKGKACTLNVVAYWWLSSGRDGQPHSCHLHLTEAEQQVYDASIRDREARQAAAWKWFEAAEPACWAWPVSGDLDSWTPTVGRIGTGNDELTVEAAEVLAEIYAKPEERASALLRHWQEGRCAICGDAGDHLVEDHDHATGLIRGLLCRSCNVKEGIYRDGKSPFDRYRKRPPVLILGGLRIRYWDPFIDDYAPAHSAATNEDPWTDAASEDIGL